MARISSAINVLGWEYDWHHCDFKYLSDKDQKRYNDYVDPIKANKKLVMAELYSRRTKAS